MHTRVFISSCFNIYCVLSAAHFEMVTNHIFCKNLTLQLWHMAKGRVAVSVGFGSVLAAQRCTVCCFWHITFISQHIRAGKMEGKVCMKFNLLLSLLSDFFFFLLALTSEKAGLVFHYDTYLLPFIALKRCWPLDVVFSARSVTFGWPLKCGAPSCGLVVWLSGIKLIF